MPLGEPPVLPFIRLPEAPPLPRPVLEVPRAELPSYRPLLAVPRKSNAAPKTKGEDEDSEESTPPKTAPPKIKLPPVPDIRQVEIPGTDVEIPLPSNEILMTAGTTATVSVAATLTATAVFKRTVQVLKPLIKKLLTRKASNNGETD